MSAEPNVIFIIDGTFEGLMSALFYGYAHKLHPQNIVDETYQTAIGDSPVIIETDLGNAERVVRGITDKLGFDFYKGIYTACLSDSEDKYIHIYNYARLGFSDGRIAQNAIATECGNAVMKMSAYVTNEAHFLCGFVRFSMLENGAFYSKIAPKTDCLEILLNHFCARMSTERFFIHDTNRAKAAAYLGNRGEAIIIPVEKLPPFVMSGDEKKYKTLWKQFYESVAIKERKNLKLQTNMMRKRFRPYMTEFEAGQD